MPHIDYFFATISPFTYIAGTRLEEIAAKHGATIAYKPVDIIALFNATGGTPPKDRHENRKSYRLQELKRQSAKAGLKLILQPAFWPINSAPSSYAIIAAQAAREKGAKGDLGALVHAFNRACWAEERNISDDEVVRDILAANGFDPSLAESGLLIGAEAYARNLDEAVKRGAFGAPFYITDTDQCFWGQDRLDDLDAHLSGKL